MLQTSRRVELFVSEAEAEFLEDAAGSSVRGMMPGEEGHCAKRLEGKRDDGSPGFDGETFAPVGRPKMDPEFINLSVEPIRPNAAAADKIAVGQKKERPVLNVIRTHKRNMALEPLFYLFLRKRAADEARHFRVDPKRNGEREIIWRPAAESESRGFQEIGSRRTHGRDCWPFGAEQARESEAVLARWCKLCVKSDPSPTRAS
jgi:hypothetical protein